MKKNKKDFLKFDTINEFDNNNLIGGFSTSLSADFNENQDLNSNNCLGGNCRHGCGYGQNVMCNMISGCGQQ